MERHRIKKIISLLVSFIFVSSCASSVRVSEKQKQEIQKNAEFEKSVQIVMIEEDATEAVSGAGASSVAQPVPSVKGASQPAVTAPKSSIPVLEASKTSKVKGSVKESAAKKEVKGTAKAEVKLSRRMHVLEDEEGFTGRRPNVDVFHVGEVVTHNVHYFKVSAGELKLKVEPFSIVNGKKSYTLATEIKTSTLFNSFYSVDDRAVAYMDFDSLRPHTYTLSVKESGQVREARVYFDFTKKQAKFWEKKITKKNGEEEKHLEWEIPDYAQNVFSALFYMRQFQWRDNKTYSFMVSHENENLTFSGTVVRREKLSTKVGDFDAIVVKPEFTLKGAFKPVGDIFIWLSDDDRKYILRIESKIKIGTLVSEVIDIKPGRP